MYGVLSKMKKKSNKSKGESRMVGKRIETFYIVVLVLVFFAGVFTARVLTPDSLDRTELNFQQQQLDLRSMYEMAEFSNLFSEKTCDKDFVEYFQVRLAELGRELAKLEGNEKIDTDYYQMLKKKYSVNQVLFYTNYKKFTDKCNSSSNMVLFLFNGSKPGVSQEQGAELDKLHEEHDIIVLPMDYKYNSGIEYFYEFYGTDKLPMLVVNYNKTFKGVTSASKIEEYLDSVDS